MADDFTQWGFETSPFGELRLRGDTVIRGPRLGVYMVHNVGNGPASTMSGFDAPTAPEAVAVANALDAADSIVASVTDSAFALIGEAMGWRSGDFAPYQVAAIRSSAAALVAQIISEAVRNRLAYGEG